MDRGCSAMRSVRLVWSALRNQKKTKGGLCNRGEKGRGDVKELARLVGHEEGI